MTSRFKLSEGLERLIFFFGIFLMIGHTMGCIWVFTGDLSTDEPNENNWIKEQSLENSTNYKIYITAIYFTVTTITTVGYGDISGTNTIEKMMCICLMICGTFLFALASGSITTIIQQYDQINQGQTERKILLKKITKLYGLPNELYFDVLKSLQHDQT